MATSTNEIDRFQNSLTEALGVDTLAVLSSADEERPFLGAETLAAFAAYLLLSFSTAFVEELKKRVGDDVKAGGRRLADVVFDRLKAAALTLKPHDAANAENRRNAISVADASLRELAAHPQAKDSVEAATKAAKAKVIEDLKAEGFSDDEARAKADSFVQTILSRVWESE
jgi:hypothetical protein